MKQRVRGFVDIVDLSLDDDPSPDAGYKKVMSSNLFKNPVI